tara:strand:+ start:8934 stop:11210 length:2277 start_codon:yes stop_codon:yes gene_type:complete
MAIPTSSNYPTAFDDVDNLYEVHDSLRVRLAEDYTVGDTSIIVEGDALALATFPESGIITLTDQCADIDERALSFHYDSRTDSTFDGLEIMPNFTDVSKPKRLTNVLQNVVADQRNNIKNALIAIEKFIGIKGTLDTAPFGDTMEGRINFMHRIALRPRAWFTVNTRIGIVPLTVEFKDLSFRTATGCPVGPITYEWNFGDQTASVVSISVIEATDTVPTSAVNVIVHDLDGGTIEKTYTEPGTYSVSLKVSDDMGEDTVEFPDLIIARIAAPIAANIEFVSRAEQDLDDDTGIIRTPTNTLIDLFIPVGARDDDPLRSHAGEELNAGGSPIDPISEYTWALADDLPHGNSDMTSASYSVGGIYDIQLRVDTELGAYRITTLEDKIDVVEKINLWLWTAPNPLISPNTMQAYEFGLLSETFKVGAGTTLDISRNDTFLEGQPDAERAQREFNKNNGFAPRSTAGSSSRNATTALFWAGGRNVGDPRSSEKIHRVSYNGFTDTYSSETSIDRPWNWASWSSPDNVYFLLGNVSSTIAPNTSPTNQVLNTMSTSSLAVASETWTNSNYRNGGDELQSNAGIGTDSFTNGNIPNHGYFSTYRTTWANNTGFLLRNGNVGDLFRLSDFYITEGTVVSEFQNLRKMSDVAGTAKVEAEVVGLQGNAYVFNNTGAISAFNATSRVWETGGPGVNSASFRLLQDTSSIGFDDAENTLLATSDGDQRAYLSYDYSDNAFIKFNSQDLTFSKLTARPAGEQWIMGVY